MLVTDSSVQHTFATALNEAMAKSKGKQFFTIKDVSKHFEVTTKTVHRWLNGHAIPTKHTFYSLCKAMPTIGERWQTYKELFEWWIDYRLIREANRKKVIFDAATPEVKVIPEVQAEVVQPPSFMNPTPPLPISPPLRHDCTYVTKAEFDTWKEEVKRSNTVLLNLIETVRSERGSLEHIHKRIDVFAAEIGWLTHLRTALRTFLKLG